MTSPASKPSRTWTESLMALGLCAALVVTLGGLYYGNPQERLIEGGILGALLSVGVGAGLWWRNETRKHFEDHLQSAELVRDSEERLRLALTAAHQGIYDLNLLTGEVCVSPEYATMLGYDPATFHQTLDKWIEQLHPDDRDRVVKAHEDCIGGRSGEYRAEFRLRTQSGDWKWILSVGKLMERTPDGRPLRMLGTHTDITDRKVSETKIQRLTQLYAALSQCNQSIVRCTDEATLFAEICRDAVQFGGMKMAWIGRVDEATQQVRPMASFGDGLGYLDGIRISTSADDPFGCGPVGIAVRENRPVWCQDFLNDPMSKPWRERAEPYHWQSFAALPLVCGGRPVGAFVLYAKTADAFDDEEKELLSEMATDISFALDNYAREALRKKTEFQLNLLHTALQSTPSSWVITDTNGIIQWVNAGFTKVTGYAADEVIGRNPRILRSGLHSVEFYRDMWTTVKRGEVWTGEMHNRRKDGSLYHEQMTIVPVRNEHGIITHFVAMKYDITEAKQTELRLLRSQRMEGIGMLAGGIAHDLNNVLSPILLSVELMKMRFPDAESHAIINAIESAARRGAGIVRQVLTFARGIDGERMPIRVADVIREMARMIEETFPRSIQIQQSLARDLPQTLGDATQLHQVLLNLAVNARDAMPEGGVLTLQADAVQVKESSSPFVGAIKPGAYIKVVVRDTGCGIPPEVMSRVFEPFFTTKEQGKGTGLGLSTVFGIVRSHGGFVDVKSTLGAGTEFQVYLPALEAPEVPVATPVRPLLVSGAGQTVLICDDEDIIRDVTGELLAVNGFKVLGAANGAEALRIVENHAAPIALAIMDVMMPGMTGDKVAVELRKRRPGLPVLFSTGMVGDAEMEKALKQQLALPATAILTKPYQQRVLMDAIGHLLKGENVISHSPFLR